MLMTNFQVVALISAVGAQKNKRSWYSLVTCAQSIVEDKLVDRIGANSGSWFVITWAIFYTFTLFLKTMYFYWVICLRSGSQWVRIYPWTKDGVCRSSGHTGKLQVLDNRTRWPKDKENEYVVQSFTFNRKILLRVSSYILEWCSLKKRMK